MLYTNKKVLATYAHATGQWGFARVEGIDWRQITRGSADGVTNLFMLLNTARSKDRTVHVQVDDATNQITAAYMV